MISFLMDIKKPPSVYLDDIFVTSYITSKDHLMILKEILEFKSMEQKVNGILWNWNFWDKLSSIEKEN